MRLLSVGNDAKTVKGEKLGYLTGILYLIPDKKLCPACTAGCRKSCLVSAGRGAFSNVYKARMRKTFVYKHRFDIFKQQLEEDIKDLIKKAEKKNMRPCIRINGTSDIYVEEVFGDLLDKYKAVQFYDYTKVWSRVATKENYFLCYSRSDKTTLEEVKYMVKAEQKNVAVVFNKVPEVWEGMKVIDGDKSDLRFLDGTGVIVGLKAKGKARFDKSGFVVKVSK